MQISRGGQVRKPALVKDVRRRRRCEGRPPPSPLWNASSSREMNLLSVARKRVRTFIPNVRIHRFLSSSSGKPDICFIMGECGMIPFPGERWQEEEEFFDLNPLLSPIPSGRIFGPVDPKKPFQVLNNVREWIQSGALVPYICRKFGHPIQNPFQRGNVGVLKGLNIVAFRKIESDPYELWMKVRNLGYAQWNTYWKETVEVMYGPSALTMLPAELDGYSWDLDNVDSPDLEEYVSNHPTHPSDIRYGNMAVEVFRLLRKQGPALESQAVDLANKARTAQAAATAQPTAASQATAAAAAREAARAQAAVLFDGNNILHQIGTDHGNAYATCEKHGVLPQWYLHFLSNKLANLPPALQGLSRDSPAVIAQLKLTAVQRGILVVEVCRHGSIHSVEREIISLVLKVFQNMDPMVSRTEILQLLRLVFPNHLRIAYLGFIDEDAWPVLDIASHNPTSTIYKTSAIHSTSYVLDKREYIVVRFGH